MRYVYFDYFRATAIFLIVIGHCYGTWRRESIIEITIANVITGGTALFVFISGFFFHSVYYEKFNYGNFIQKKTINVLVPYILLSAGFILVYWLLKRKVHFPFELSGNAALNNTYAIVVKFFTGQSLLAYWYIPFVMLLFAISPIILSFVKLDIKTAWVTVVVLFAFSAYAHRPLMNLNPIHSLVYFAPFYLFGIVYSRCRIGIDRWAKQNLLMLFFIVFGIAFLMSFLGQEGNVHKWNPFEWNGVDFMVPQKIALILTLLAALKLIENYDIKFLKYVAKASFSVFFIHPWILFFLVFFKINNYLEGGYGFALRVIIVLTASLVVAELVKLVLKDKSKYLIGY